MELRLHSPVGAGAIVLHWPLPSSLNPDNDDDAEEVFETIRFVCEDFPQLRLALSEEILNKYNPTSYDSVKSLCEYFNGVIAEMHLSNSTPPLEVIRKNLSRDLLEHILVQVYNQTVKEPDKLNQYEPFSPEVYGETSFELICQMIDHMSISEEDIFIDLGSGVGQVVLQMAALTSCKLCLGIEKADVPSQYAENMSKNFRKWMAWFGKTYGDYKIIKGDFLDDKFREKITSSSLIFVNNFAFGPSVDHNLKQIFADLKDGARIVSSKAFCPLNFRITDRNLTDIGTIMHVSEMQPMCESVSWTGKPVSYYLHVIDRTKLERYFQRLKQPPQPKKQGRTSNCNSNSNSREGSVESNGRRSANRNNSKPPKKPVSNKWSSDEGSSDNEAPRVTTRRAWTEYCKLLSQNNQNNSFTGKNEKNGVVKKERDIKYPKRKCSQKVPSPSPIRQQPTRTSNTRCSRSTKRKNMTNGITNKCQKTSNNRNPSAGFASWNITSNPSTSDSIFLVDDEDNDRRPVPETLRRLLRTYKTQFLDMMETMKTQNYIKKLNEEILKEQEGNLSLKYKIEFLQSHIKKLQLEGTELLKKRMSELGVENYLPATFLEQAKDVVLKHKNLQIQVTKLEQTIQSLEEEREELYRRRYKEIVTKGIEEGLSTPMDVIDQTFQKTFNVFPQR
ncbi:histone-lysine N-methyltransferase, H3 lysine-79 specific-like [Cimex lectularius]|uniref:Histone-lysine N-methyltransferase, H3 lysine-79 specific n=1 Tax=Cimex lectularius TaxID=79782 RepID=A0A8I6TIE6_CIMLE|nr:histone-lysine N-methyltransferase, H3 lysine-79 specific-like [Cimex lectularius]